MIKGKKTTKNKTKTARKSGRWGKPGKCSVCHRVGHNKRTCPKA